jgi:hypothetical protein
MKPILRYVQLPARILEIHPNAQGQLIHKHLRYLIENMDFASIGMIHAVHCAIGGVVAYWVVDGQHRVRALVDGGWPDYQVLVAIHDEVTNEKDAAQLYRRLSKVKIQQKFDDFRTGVIAGDVKAVSVDRILRRNALTAVRGGKGNNQVNCVAALYAMFALDGTGRALDHALATAKGAWGAAPAALEGHLLKGLAKLYALNPNIEFASMVNKLARHGTPSQLVGQARYTCGSVEPPWS